MKFQHPLGRLNHLVPAAPKCTAAPLPRLCICMGSWGQVDLFRTCPDDVKQYGVCDKWLCAPSRLVCAW